MTYLERLSKALETPELSAKLADFFESAGQDVLTKTGAVSVAKVKALLPESEDEAKVLFTSVFGEATKPTADTTNSVTTARSRSTVADVISLMLFDEASIRENKTVDENGNPTQTEFYGALNIGDNPHLDTNVLRLTCRQLNHLVNQASILGDNGIIRIPKEQRDTVQLRAWQALQQIINTTVDKCRATISYTAIKKGDPYVIQGDNTIYYHTMDYVQASPVMILIQRDIAKESHEQQLRMLELERAKLELKHAQSMYAGR